MEIGVILKNERKQLNLTQEQVAEKIYVSQKSISNWENGKTFPDIDSLIRVAHLFDLSLDSILLEDSQIVENLKTQAEIHSLKKIIKVPTLTSLCIMLIILTQTWTGQVSLTASILLAGCAAFNAITIFYFESKIHQLKETKYTTRDWLIIAIVICVSLISCFFILR